MFRTLLKETANLKIRQGIDEYGKSQYTEKIIKCRKENKVKLVLSQKGETLTSFNRYFSDTQVSVGDEIDDKKVMAVNTIKDGRGKTLGWEVFL